MRGFPDIACNTEHEESVDGLRERRRQDSVVPSPSEIDGTKPLGFVEEGLVPDHSFDTWTAVWDTAYESRVNTYHHESASIPPSFCSTLPPGTSAPLSLGSTLPTTERRSSSKSTRPPLSSQFSVTDAEVKAFVFGSREDRKRGHESPEVILRPKIYRRGSEVPSLVTSESSRDSGLEDLEEEAEKGEDIEEVDR
jgi:hypothetical protein